MVEDQTQYMMEAYRQIFPNFCLNDWSVWETINYHFTYNYLVVFISYLADIGVAFFFIYILLSVLLMWGIFQLIEHLGLDTRIIPLVYVFAFYFIKQEISSAKLTIGAVLPTTLATPFVLLFVLYLLQRRYFLAGLMGGVSGFFHINFGYGSIVIMVLYMLINREYREDKPAFFLAPLVALAVVFPNLLPVFRNFAATLGGSADGIYAVYVRYRCSHHLYPPHYESGTVLYMLGIYGLGIVELIRNYSERSVKKVFILTGVVGALCLFSLVFSFIYYWPTYLRLYFWRFVPYISLIFLILIANALKTFLSSENRSRQFTAVTVILSLGISGYYQGWTLLALWLTVFLWALIRLTSFFDGRETPVRVGNGLIMLLSLAALSLNQHFNLSPMLGILLAAPLLAGLYIFGEKIRLNKHLLLFIVTFTVAVTLTSAQVKPRQYVNPFKPGLPKPLQSLAYWAKNSTPPGTVFIAPPDIKGFRALSQRGLLVNVKYFPMKPAEIKEWWKRLWELADINEMPDENEWYMFFLERYYNLPPRHFQSIAQKYNCQYIIVYKDQPNLYHFVKAGWPIRYENPIYAVFAIPKQNQRIEKSQKL